MQAQQPQPEFQSSQPPSAAGPAPDHERADEMKAIAREVDRIAKVVERMNLGDYIGLLQRPGRILWLNFLAGMARGLGAILGATVLVWLIVAIAHRIVASHLPGVSDFLSQFLHILRQQGKGH
jgi:Domain of unknown function (DUF5665)